MGELKELEKELKNDIKELEVEKAWDELDGVKCCVEDMDFGYLEDMPQIKIIKQAFTDMQSKLDKIAEVFSINIETYYIIKKIKQILKGSE